MATRKHAILSASGASRWLNCTPSAILESKFESKSSSYADEGTLAHRLSDAKLLLAFNQKTQQWYKNELLDIQKSEYYNESMEEFTDSYVDFVVEIYNGYSNAIVFTEQRVDLTKWVPEGFGTNDCMIIANGTLEIIDLKYGKGVPVYAEDNKQMMLYALGSLEKFEFIYDIEEVKMTIYQPRIDNNSTYVMTRTALIKWAEEELMPKAKLAYGGDGEFVPGSHCLFCKAKALCKANADYQLQLAKSDFKKPELLNDMEVSEILARHKLFVDWVNSVNEYALEQSLKNGKVWPGFKVVEGRSNRKYKDEQEVANVLAKKGYKEEDLFVKKLLGITAMQSYLGKLTFDTLLSNMLIKPAGSPALVPEKDKRPAMNSNESAKQDFS